MATDMNTENKGFEEWLEWANQPSQRREGRTNILPEIVEYLKAHPEDFIEPVTSVEGCPWIAAPGVDPQTWEAVSETIIIQCLDNHFGKKYNAVSHIPKEELVRLIAGIIGPDAANRFAQFVADSPSSL